MARLKAGILAAVSGKVGTVVGSSWKGIDYIRSKGGRRKKRKEKPSPALAGCNTKFKLATRFITTMRPFLKIGYREFEVRKTACNAAHSYIMKHCFTSAYPELKIDYSLVKVSRGGLPCTTAAAVSALPAGKVEFSWDPAGIGSASGTDSCMALLYCESENRAVFKLPGTLRSSGQFILDASYWAGKSFHAWLAFSSANEENVSDSVYVGELIVQQ